VKQRINDSVSKPSQASEETELGFERNGVKQRINGSVSKPSQASEETDGIQTRSGFVVGLSDFFHRHTATFSYSPASSAHAFYVYPHRLKLDFNTEPGSQQS
jgi:hypothetical protein